MGAHLHKLSNINIENRQAFCVSCGLVDIISRGKKSWGCRNLYRTKKTNYNKPYLVYRKDYCENLECTATIVDKCQLDVHHIDGDHLNNDIENLQTLCSNCHRLVTKLNMEYVNKIYHP